MSNPPPSGSAAACANAALSILIRLAKREMQIELVLKSNGSREMHVVKRGVPGRCGGVIAFAVFADALNCGWLTDADGQGLRWSLSPEGRLALRRAKSAGGGAPARSQAAAVSNSPTATMAASVDAAESPLGWLRKRRDKSGQPLISAMQFDAGERLRGDLWFAQMSPRVTANWHGVGGSSKSGGGLGIDIRDNVAAAQQRVRRALTAVGPMSAGLLLDVCGHLLGLEQIERNRGWPQRSGKIALHMALSELARHYGLPGAEAAGAPLATRLRHWGVDDYRPGIEAGGE